ncbi:MAG: efflux RND transporter permease subunit, partial [Spirochaetia bacterium]|nr:efflux RND transporter permease subunit [Spirochaetia bacterium]
QMRHRKRVLALFALVIILPFFLLFFIPFKTVPEMESDRVGIKVSFPYGYPFETYMAWAGELEERIRRSGLCEDLTIFGGYDRESQQDLNTYVFEMKGKGKPGLYELFDESGWDYQILESRNYLSVLVGDDNIYCVTSSDRAALEKEYLLIEERAHKDRVSAVAVHGIKNCPEYRISVSENVFSAELSPADIFNAVSLAAEGCVVSQMELDGEPVDIRLRYSKEFIDSPEKIAALQIKENGKILFTQPFIQLKKEYDYFALDRLDRQNALLLTFFPDFGNGYGAKRVSDRFTRVHKREILILFSGALVFIWFVLAIQFESCKIPFLILCTVPLGISGSLLSLFIAGKSLNISSVLGLMILSGTGVNSGILILSDVARGSPVVRAALSRLRTMCLTLLSTVVALLPVALFDSNPIQNCASISLLGGLVFGTAALFALIPVLIKEDCSE